MKVIYAVAFAILALGVWIARGLPKLIPADHCFAQVKADKPDHSHARSIFTASETPMIVVSGKGFETCELRLRFYRTASTSSPQARPVADELLKEAGPVRLAPGSFYGLSLPDIAPGNFRVQLLRNGETVRELQIKVTK